MLGLFNFFGTSILCLGGCGGLGIGITGFKLNDLFSNDSRTFRTRFEAVLNKINATDYLSFNTKIDVSSTSKFGSSIFS